MEVKALSDKPKIDPKKAKEMKERTKERNLLVQEMKSKGSLTINELSKATKVEKSKVLKHLMAMRQFGKVSIVGERNSELVYSLSEEDKS